MNFYLQVKLNLSLLEDINDDSQFALKLAQEESVIVTPGTNNAKKFSSFWGNSENKPRVCVWFIKNRYLRNELKVTPSVIEINFDIELLESVEMYQDCLLANPLILIINKMLQGKL